MIIYKSCGEICFTQLLAKYCGITQTFFIVWNYYGIRWASLVNQPPLTGLGINQGNVPSWNMPSSDSRLKKCRNFTTVSYFNFNSMFNIHANIYSIRIFSSKNLLNVFIFKFYDYLFIFFNCDETFIIKKITVLLL